MITALILGFALQQRAIFQLPLDGITRQWSLISYGAQPTLEWEASTGRNATPAAHLSSEALSDAAISEDVTVRPGAPYELSVWVKTERLDPHGSPVFGTIVAQSGGANLATGVSHQGNTDWTKETIYFSGPDSGSLHIALFLCGWGHGTGSVWFQDVHLTQVSPANPPLKITKTPLVQGRINPMQYGQFIEYLCDLVPSMWAEKLYDTSFEGLAPYKFVYIKETDFKEKPWYAFGQPNRLRLSQDPSTFISGATSKKIDLSDGLPCEGGLAQDGLSLNKGVACRFSIYVKGRAAGTLRVKLFHGQSRYAETKLPITTSWKKVTANLVPPVTDPNAQIALTTSGPGTIWLDSASLMPADSVGGWRKDVVNVLTDLKPGVIRIGGSVMDDANLGSFEWTDTIGDPDRRPPFPAWGGVQPTGAGLEEIVQLCQRVGAEPLICVRYEKKSPQDAAAEVEYFNGEVTTPMGALRAKNGHPKPYGIRYWQVGNERWGETYWKAVPLFCAAMKAVDPTIKLFSSFPSDRYVQIAGKDLDYLCPHQYDVADISGTKAQLDDVRRMIQQFGNGKNLKVAVTEWNTTAGDAGLGRAKLWTLKNALDCSRYQNLLHREADIVEIANRSNLANSFCSGIIQTSRSELYLTPTYYAQQLYATYAGSRPLKIESNFPVNLAPDISATLSEDGQWLTLFAVNEASADLTRLLDFSELASPSISLDVWTLADTQHAGEPDVSNSFFEPIRIRPKRSKLDRQSNKLNYTFPANSLSVLRIRLDPAKT